MKRKHTALGLALIAALAMSAMFATAAQAKGTLKANLPVAEATVTGVPITHNNTTNHTWTPSFGGAVTCGTTLFEGTVKDGDTELTITPTYSNCEQGGRPVTVFTNSCDYKFKGGEGGPHHFTQGTVSLSCPAGVTGITVEVYNDMAHKELRCRYVVHPFAFRGENTLENTTGNPGDVDVTTTVENIAVKRTFGSLFQCGSENQTSTYTGGTTMRAYSDEAHKTQVDLRVEP